MHLSVRRSIELCIYPTSRYRCHKSCSGVGLGGVQGPGDLATVVLPTKPKRIAQMASSNTRYHYLYHLVPVGAFPGTDDKPYFPPTYQQVRSQLQCTSNANGRRMPRPVARAQQVSGGTLSTSACRTASFTSQRILSSY